MNSINWKLRLQNKATLSALLGSLVIFVYAISHALGVDLPVDQETALGGVAALVTAGVAIGVVNDPTTEGLKDSPDALEYDKPRATDCDLPAEADEVTFDEDAEG